MSKSLNDFPIIYFLSLTLQNVRALFTIIIKYLYHQRTSTFNYIDFTRLKNDNERLRRIINNDSTNSSLPPSTDKKPSKAANEYNRKYFKDFSR